MQFSKVPLKTTIWNFESLS